MGLISAERIADKLLGGGVRHFQKRSKELETEFQMVQTRERLDWKAAAMVNGIENEEIRHRLENVMFDAYFKTEDETNNVELRLFEARSKLRLFQERRSQLERGLAKIPGID